MSEITTLASRQKRQLALLDERTLESITGVYLSAYNDLEGDIDALMLAIEKLEDPTENDIKALPQYKRLIKNMESELDDFTAYVLTTIGAAGLAAINAALADSSALMGAYGVQSSGMTASSIRALLEYLRKGGPLYNRLQLLTKSTVDWVVEQMIEGVLSGFNPRKIAGIIRDAFGRGLTDALRNIRTLQLWAYRDTALLNYQNSGVVDGWVWFAELDEDVCMSCVAMHGTIHGFDEKLEDHYNGRCAALPYIAEFGNPVDQSGKDWFNSLSPEQQRQLMGPGRYDAWKGGRFDFDRLSRVTENEIYGKMRTETPLFELIGE